MDGGPATARDGLVIDDHPLVARGIAAYLSTHCGFGRVRLADDAASALNWLASDDTPALAVVDFWLPGGACLTLLQQFRQRSGLTRLLVLSGDEDPAVHVKVKAAGAHGFVCKHEPPEVFAQAVAAVLDGREWFAPSHTHPERLPEAPRRELPMQAHELGLTDRQGQVLGLMLRGLPNKRIARLLDVSEQTVKEHVTGILSRLGVANRLEAIQRLQGRRIEP